MRLKGSEIAKRRLAIEGWRTPPAQISSLLFDDLARPREVAPYRVESLLGINHNASLTAQYKTGKTNLLCDLAGCLADGRPFLGQLAVRAPYGRIGVWNDEMDRDDFLDYVRPIGVIYQARIVTAHLRGYRVPILTDIGMDWAVKWLFENQVEIPLNDSWARLCAWSGIGENDNSGVVRLAEAINEIKSRAGVTNFVTTVHTGRAKHDEGSEHGRGATALDDWVDARWVLTRQGDDRFLYAEGRSVGMEETMLSYDAATRRSSIGGGNRAEARKGVGVGIVVEEVARADGINKSDLINAVRPRIPSRNQADAADAIGQAIKQGLIHTTQGPRKALLHHLSPSPEYQQQLTYMKGWKP
jgi:hypothetical protein